MGYEVEFFFEEVEYLKKNVKKYRSGDLSFKLPKRIRYIYIYKEFFILIMSPNVSYGYSIFTEISQ